MTLPGTIAGSGGLIEVGSGTLALDAVNSFNGGITVQSGMLSLPLSGALPSGTMLTMAAPGSSDVRFQGGRSRLFIPRAVRANSWKRM